MDDEGEIPPDQDLAPPGDDAHEASQLLDGLLDTDAAMARLAAERFLRTDAFHRHQTDDAARYGRGITQVVERGIRLEVASALRITETAAEALLARAEALVHRYPPVLAALGDAWITERHADILVDTLDRVEPEFRDRILAAGLPLAEQQPVGTFRRELRKLVDRLRSSTLAQRHEKALELRRVVLIPEDDGMGCLSVYLPMVEGTAIMNRITRMAKAIGAADGETRTLDQIRADVAGDLLVDGQAPSLPAAARGVRARVVVTVPVLTLLAEGAVEGDAMPVVEGIGPIPVARARELCGGADGWMRVLTHPETGMVLSVGREQYSPPAPLRRLVKWRADRCMGPGCGMPASRCHIDHNVAWEHGGSTSLDNHAPFCEGHHRVKHHGGWTVTQVGGYGAVEWTSPAGRRYRVEPERRVPVFTPAAPPVDTTPAPF